MKINRICALYDSSTGNTRKTVCAAAQAAAAALDLPWQEIRFSRPGDREKDYVFGPEDLVFVGSPTYAGKMPNKLLPDFQSKLHGEGAFAAAIVTFGNRSYDNALAELCVTLEQDGFHTISGGAFVGQHAFALELAKGRPNAEDLEEACSFGRKTAEKLSRLAEIPAPVRVRGDAAAPYYIPRGTDGQPAKFLKAKPKTHEGLCVECGTCAEVCPMGSIDWEDVTQVTGICIKCQACVRQCPTGAKYFDDPAFLSHRQMLETEHTAPQSNEVFL